MVSTPTKSNSHLSEAPAGFDGGSNGFAEEFCARQDELVDSPNSPKIPADECDFAAAEEEFTGPETVADGLGPIILPVERVVAALMPFAEAAIDVDKPSDKDQAEAILSQRGAA